MSDLEKIKEQEEKEREELQKKSEKEEEKNISEGNLDINDPVEIKVDSETDVNTAEEILLNSETTPGKNEQENINESTKKPEKIFRFKRYKIQEVIKPNQVILVQVLKDERGQKGAALKYFYFNCRKIYCFNA